MSIQSRLPACAALSLLSVVFQPVAPAFAQSPVSVVASGPTYADLADLADSAELVLRAEISKLIRVEDARAPGLRSGQGRFYIKAKTRALLLGPRTLGESLTYLVDLPLDGRGRAPAIKRKEVLLFARPVPGRPGELQLVRRNAQLLWDESTEATLRSILTAQVAPDAPGPVSGVREVIHVPGNLAGAGETQIFLATPDGSAASITVQHRPGSQPQWGVSFSELIADIGNPPPRNTLAWYRLACFLPNSLPPGANLSDSAEGRRQAVSDYRMVLGELGVCHRSPQ